MVFPHQLCTTYLVQFRLDRHCARWHSGHDGHFNPPNQQLHDCGDLDSQRCCWSFAQRFLQPRVSWFHCLRFLPLHWDLLDVLDGVNHVWCERAELGFHQHHEALDLPGIGHRGDMGDIDSQWITVVLLCIIVANLSNHEKSWLHVVKCTQMYLDSHMVHWPSWKACTCRVPSSWACAARCNANLLRSIIFFVATGVGSPVRFVQRTQQNTATTTWSSHNGWLVINAESFQVFFWRHRDVFPLKQGNESGVHAVIHR